MEVQLDYREAQSALSASIWRCGRVSRVRSLMEVHTGECDAGITLELHSLRRVSDELEAVCRATSNGASRTASAQFNAIEAFYLCLALMLEIELLQRQTAEVQDRREVTRAAMQSAYRKVYSRIGG